MASGTVNVQVGKNAVSAQAMHLELEDDRPLKDQLGHIAKQLGFRVKDLTDGSRKFNFYTKEGGLAADRLVLANSLLSQGIRAVPRQAGQDGFKASPGGAAAPVRTIFLLDDDDATFVHPFPANIFAGRSDEGDNELPELDAPEP